MLFQGGHVAISDSRKASDPSLQEALKGLVGLCLVGSEPETFRGQAKKMLGNVERAAWNVSADRAHVLISLVSKGPVDRRALRRVNETIMVNILRVRPANLSPLRRFRNSEAVCPRARARRPKSGAVWPETGARCPAKAIARQLSIQNFTIRKRSDRRSVAQPRADWSPFAWARFRRVSNRRKSTCSLSSKRADTRSWRYSL